MINNLLASTTLNVVDIVLLAIIGISALSGLISGFSKKLVKFLGGIVSLVLAVSLCSKCADLLNDKFGLADKLYDVLKGFLTSVFDENLLNSTLGQLSDGTVNIKNFSGPTLILNALVGLVAKGVPAETLVVDAIVPTFAYYLTIIIGFIVCYILFKILFAIIGSILKSLVKLAMLGAIDKLLGFLLGAIQGVITCYMLVSIVSIIPVNQVADILNASTIANLIHSVNASGILFGGINPAEYINNVLGSLS